MNEGSVLKKIYIELCWGNIVEARRIAESYSIYYLDRPMHPRKDVLLSISNPRFDSIEHVNMLIGMSVRHQYDRDATQLIRFLLARTRTNTYLAFDYIINSGKWEEIKMFIKYGHRLEKVTLRHNITLKMHDLQSRFLHARKVVLVILALKKRGMMKRLDRFLLRQLGQKIIHGVQ